MATANFSCTQNAIKKTLTVFAVLFVLFLIVSCASQPKKQEAEKTPTPVATAPTPEPRSTTPVPRATSFPKIGLILGPGGLKSFAHIGVLRELEGARIPIHSIVGIEWGALVGGLYSLKGKSNDVEWKLLKLKKDDLPSPAWFRTDAEPKEIASLENYFREVFENKSIGDSSILFSCPSVTVNGERTVWLKAGGLKDAMLMCVPYPPLYKPHNDYVASAFEVKAAAKRLRDGGAEIIIFINVLAQGEILKSKKGNAGFETQLLWTAIRNRMTQDQEAVDFVIGVHTRDYDILNYDARRSMILFGSQSGMVAVKKLSEKYGF